MEVLRSSNPVVTTHSPGPTRKTVWFSEMSLEDLRNFAKWPTGTKEQILAWCKNRYPCGYMYELVHQKMSDFGIVPFLD